MKKRSRSVPEAYRKGRIREASRREGRKGIRVLESSCVSPTNVGERPAC